MLSMITRKQANKPRKIISCFITLTFVVSMVIPPVSTPVAYAQSAAGMLGLPLPGTLVTTSPAFTPAIVSGITIYPDEPLQFDFIINTGTDNLQGEALEKESKKLINYFLASLTIPEDELWVNLSPYEKDRIIAQGLGSTEMGRDMLAQDYLLKQLSASLMYPEDEVGSTFWQRVHKKAREKFGTTDIPTSTFNKIWIVPQRADVYITSPEDSPHNTTSVFVMDSYLKVMLEEDYRAMAFQQKATAQSRAPARDVAASSEKNISNQIVREILIPEIEREVNEGKNFANLRQIFHSMILASWYKQNLKKSLIGQVYMDKNKTQGIDLEDKDIKNKIYEQYVAAFKKGVYNYIREDYDEATRQVIPRKYFSGGIIGSNEFTAAPLSRRWLDEELRFDHATVKVRGDVLGGNQAMLNEGELIQNYGEVVHREGNAIVFLKQNVQFAGSLADSSVGTMIASPESIRLDVKVLGNAQGNLSIYDRNTNKRHFQPSADEGPTSDSKLIRSKFLPFDDAMQTSMASHPGYQALTWLDFSNNFGNPEHISFSDGQVYYPTGYNLGKKFEQSFDNPFYSVVQHTDGRIEFAYVRYELTGTDRIEGYYDSVRARAFIGEDELDPETVVFSAIPLIAQGQRIDLTQAIQKGIFQDLRHLFVLPPAKHPSNAQGSDYVDSRIPEGQRAGVFFGLGQLSENDYQKAAEALNGPVTLSASLPVSDSENIELTQDEMRALLASNNYREETDDAKVQAGQLEEGTYAFVSENEILIFLKPGIYPHQLIGRTSGGEIFIQAISGASGRVGVSVKELFEYAGRLGLTDLLTISQGTGVVLGFLDQGQPNFDNYRAVIGPSEGRKAGSSVINILKKSADVNRAMLASEALTHPFNTGQILRITYRAARTDTVAHDIGWFDSRDAEAQTITIENLDLGTKHTYSLVQTRERNTAVFINIEARGVVKSRAMLALDTPEQVDDAMEAFEQARVVGLSDDEKLLRSKAKERMAELIPDDVAVSLDESNEILDAVPVFQGLTRPLWDDGPSAVNAPFSAEVGGYKDGLGPMAETILTTEIAIASQSVALTHDVWMGLTASILDEYGTDEQKEQFLKRLLNAEIMMSYSLTEPGSGSDAANMRTTAVKDGDEYVFNGEKTFITVGTLADYSIVFAITDKAAHDEKTSKGISAFIVPMDTPGVTVTPLHSMAGQRGTGTARISFSDARIPAKNMLGAENRGFPIAMKALDSGRIAVSTIILSALEVSLEEVAKKYKQLVEEGAPRQRLETMKLAIEEMMNDAYAARLLLNDAVRTKEKGQAFTLEAATVKLKAAEDAVNNIARAIELVGPEALLKGHPLERVYRDTKVLAILEGSTQIMRLVVGRRLAEGFEAVEGRKGSLYEVLSQRALMMDENLAEHMEELADLYQEHSADRYLQGRIGRRMIDLYAEGRALELMAEAAQESTSYLASEILDSASDSAVKKARNFVAEANALAEDKPAGHDTVPVAWEEMGQEVERLIREVTGRVTEEDRKDENLGDIERMERAVQRRRAAMKDIMQQGYIGASLVDDYIEAGIDSAFRDYLLRKVAQGVGTVGAGEESAPALGDPALALMLAEQERGMYALKQFGHEEKLEPYLSGEKTIAEAVIDVTDYDLQREKEAVVVEEDGKFLISGKVQVVINGQADTFIVFAQDIGGTSAFLVDKNDVQDTTALETLGLHGAAPVEIELDDTQGTLLGERGRGNEVFSALRAVEANMVRAVAKGTATYLADKGEHYATHVREAFGQPIINFPDVRELIEESRDHIREMDTSGQPARLLQLVSEKVLQAHGGIGYSTEETVASLWMAAEVMRIVEAHTRPIDANRAMLADFELAEGQSKIITLPQIFTRGRWREIKLRFSRDPMGFARFQRTDGGSQHFLLEGEPYEYKMTSRSRETLFAYNVTDNGGRITIEDISPAKAMLGDVPVNIELTGEELRTTPFTKGFILEVTYEKAGTGEKASVLAYFDGRDLDENTLTVETFLEPRGEKLTLSLKKDPAKDSVVSVRIAAWLKEREKDFPVGVVLTGDDLKTFDFKSSYALRVAYREAGTGEAKTMLGWFRSRDLEKGMFVVGNLDDSIIYHTFALEEGTDNDTLVGVAILGMLNERNKAMLGETPPEMLVSEESLLAHEFGHTDVLKIVYYKPGDNSPRFASGRFVTRSTHGDEKSLIILEFGTGKSRSFAIGKHTSKDYIAWIEVNRAMLAGEKFEGDNYDPIFYFGTYANEINDNLSRGSPTMKRELGGKGAGLFTMSSPEIQSGFAEFIDGVTGEWLAEQGLGDLAELFHQIKDRIKLNVPPGYTISTEQTQRWEERGKEFSVELLAEMETALVRLEGAIGKKLGAEDGNPLTIAVRSGAKESMPGMMDTILNLGLTDKATEALAAQGNAKLAWDSYRRFIESYGRTVLQIDEEDDLSKKVGFKYLIKEVAGDRNETQLEAEEYKRLTELYKEEIERQGKGEIPQDARAQYRNAVEAVMRSTFNERANEFRQMQGLKKEDTVSAVNIVAMVLGNRNDRSGSGVAFTRSKVTGERKFNATWYFNAQGEDVVAGRTEGEYNFEDMKDKEPEVALNLFLIGQFLEQYYKDVQDMEFTYEHNEATGVTTNYMLQTRNLKRSSMSEVRTAMEMLEEGLISKEDAIKRITPKGLRTLLTSRFDPEDKEKAIAEGRLLSKNGLDAAPGAGVGAIVFDAETAAEWAAQSRAVGLLRDETSPEDIGGMRVSEFVYTREGNKGSHAALVANIIGIPAVVGDGSMVIDFGAKTVTFTKDDGEKVTLEEGDIISVDGTTGEVFLGAIKTVDSFILTAQNIEAIDKVESVIGTLREWIETTDDDALKSEYEKNIKIYEEFVRETRAKQAGDQKLTGEQWDFYRQYQRAKALAFEVRDENNGLGLGANAENPLDVLQAILHGAERLGLVRTEHMFSGDGRELSFQKMIMAKDETGRRAALAEMQALQQADFEQIFLFAEDRPVTIRLIDPPLHEFLPREESKMRVLAQVLGLSVEDVKVKLKALKDKNPMFGTRGARLSILFPEIIEMQVNAIFAAVKKVKAAGQEVHPEIFVPLVGNAKEFGIVGNRVLAEANKQGLKRREDLLLGTMVEITAGAVNINDIARAVDFISIGSNDLVQGLLKISRDDGKEWLANAELTGVLEDNPFVTLPPEAARVIATTIAAARAVNPEVKVKCGICGEQGVDVKSITETLAPLGIDYVSGGPSRLPMALFTIARESLKGHKGVEPRPRPMFEPVIEAEEVPSIAEAEDFEAQVSAAVDYVEMADKTDDAGAVPEAESDALASLRLYGLYVDDAMRRNPNFQEVHSWARDFKGMNVKIFSKSSVNLGSNPVGEDGLGLITTDELLKQKNVRTLVQAYLLLTEESKRKDILKKIADIIKSDLPRKIGLPTASQPSLNIMLPNIALSEIFEYKTKEELDAAIDALLIYPAFETRAQILEGIARYDEANPAIGQRGSRVFFTQAASLYTAIVEAFVAVAANSQYQYLNISLPFIINGKEVDVIRKGFSDDDGKVIVPSVDKAIKRALSANGSKIPVGIGASIETPAALINAADIARQLKGTKGTGPITIETKKITEAVWAAFEDDARKGFFDRYLEEGIWDDDPYRVAPPDVRQLIGEAIVAIKSQNPNQVVNLMLNPRDKKLMAVAHQLGVDNILVHSRHAELGTLAAAQAAVTAPESNRAMLGGGGIGDKFEDSLWEQHAREAALRETEKWRPALEKHQERLLAIRRSIDQWARVTTEQLEKQFGQETASHVLAHLFTNALDAILTRIVEQDEDAYLGKISWKVEANEAGDLSITIEDNGVGFDEKSAKALLQYQSTGGNKKTLAIIAGHILDGPTFMGSQANAYIHYIKRLLESNGRQMGFTLESMDAAGTQHRKNQTQVTKDILRGGILVDYKVPYVIPAEERTEQGTTLVFDSNLQAQPQRQARETIIEGSWSEESMLVDMLLEGSEEQAEEVAERVALLNEEAALRLAPALVQLYARPDTDVAFRTGTLAIALGSIGPKAASVIRREADKYTDDADILDELDGIAQNLEGTISDRGVNSEQDSNAAMLGDIPGGIDLNPNHFNINQSGSDVQFNLPAVSPEVYRQNIDGIMPVIIQITPVTNFPVLIFGEKQPSPDADRRQLSRAMR